MQYLNLGDAFSVKKSVLIKPAIRPFPLIRSHIFLPKKNGKKKEGEQATNYNSKFCNNYPRKIALSKAREEQDFFSKRNNEETRRSVEHCTPHADGVWMNELGWSQ